MRQIEGIELLEEVSRTPFCILYRGLYGNTQTFVTLYRSDTDEAYWRWYNQLSIHAHLLPPNFQQLLHIGQLDQGYYHLLEYFQGNELDKLIRQARLPLQQALQLGRQIAHAMAVAHCCFVVHCNLRLSNIVLVKEHDFKIIRFEYGKTLAGRCKVDDEQFPMFHIPPDPITPEQRAGLAHEIGPATDIYAWGVILYQLMNWTATFPAEEVKAKIQSAVWHGQQSGLDLLPGCPADLEAIWVKCLQQNPGDRYPDGNALVKDLEKCFGPK